jgi:hypothetical protein
MASKRSKARKRSSRRSSRRSRPARATVTRFHLTPGRRTEAEGFPGSVLTKDVLGAEALLMGGKCAHCGRGDIVDVFSTSPAVVKRATALFGRDDVVNVHKM